MFSTSLTTPTSRRHAVHWGSCRNNRCPPHNNLTRPTLTLKCSMTSSRVSWYLAEHLGVQRCNCTALHTSREAETTRSVLSLTICQHFRCAISSDKSQPLRMSNVPQARSPSGSRCDRWHFLSHMTMYNVQCTMYNVQCTMYNVQCTMYSVQCTVYSVQCTVYSVQCAVCSVQCAVYSVQCTVYSVQCTVDSGQWTVDSGEWTVDSGQWTRTLIITTATTLRGNAGSNHFGSCI